MNLVEVINELMEERDLDSSVLIDIICEGMLGAYQKRYPGVVFKVTFDKNTGDLSIFAEKEVVSTVEDEDTQISLRKAKGVEPKAVLAEKIWTPFDGAIGRVEILRAKQIIAQRIKEVEALAIYNAFNDKKGTIVIGSVHKVERGGVLVSLQDAFAFLPKSLSIPGERYVPGYPIRALLKEVHPDPRGDNQLVLDRASVDFLKQLFELEIPEVFEKLVEIRAAARVPGYKSKVVVASNDSNIDPVGTCVGVGGARIKPILKEVGGEKIDVIGWSDSLEQRVKNSLKPAEVNRVEVENGVAKVWLEEDQRSFAIGKMGQNIKLASQICGVVIELADGGKISEDINQLISQSED